MLSTDRRFAGQAGAIMASVLNIHAVGVAQSHHRHVAACCGRGEKAYLREGGITWPAHVLSVLLRVSASAFCKTNKGVGRPKEKVGTRQGCTGCWASTGRGPQEEMCGTPSSGQRSIFWLMQLMTDQGAEYN